MRKLILSILLFSSLITKAQLPQQLLFALLGQPPVVTTPPAWVPPPGLVAWFRSDTAVTVSGGKATQWNDISGNGRHLLSTASAKPQYYTNTLNGKPSIEVDPSTSGQMLQTGSNFPTDTALTIYLVIKMNGSTGGYGRLFEMGAYNTGYWGGREGSNTKLVAGVKAANPPYGSIADIPLATWKLVKLKWSTSTTNLLKVGSTTGSTYNTSGTPTPGKFTLFADGALGTPGKFGATEILIFNRVLTSSEETSIETHLNTDYAL